MKPTQQLAERSILITGAASGIGRATALLAAQRGACVTLVDVDLSGLESAVSDILGNGGRAAAALADVRRESDVTVAVAMSIQEFGHLDGAVCAAGVSGMVPVLEMPLATWETVVNTNLTGMFLSVRAVARAIVETAGRGSIVTVASDIAIVGQRRGAHYAASKAGVLGLTKSVALELGERGIRCNCLAPGIIDTPMLAGSLARGDTSAQDVDAYQQAVPLGRIGTPLDVAHVACFLLSDESEFMTGQTLHVDGGKLIR
jgi:NAD(P)-dependent dehydrogenase (short-subunit alcohol dehydrogenase family)